jgi:RNA chaperone Hfq
MLNSYLAAQTPVAITLQNKIRVSGRIKAFDSYVIIMEGQKREIVYRHAVSSLTAIAFEEPKRTTDSSKSAPARAFPRTTKTAGKPRSPQPPALSASSTETSINTSMKEGLLKWMQEQKAAK